MNYKKFLVWYSPVFVIVLGFVCWLMYFMMFLKNDFILTTAYIDEMAYSDDKFFIEVNYFPNMFEAKINYYTDTDIPEKNDDGSYGEKYTYSSGVQFDGGYQCKRELDSNYWSYDYYYNKMINCTYYNTADNGTSYEAISKLENQNHWVYDVNGQLCLLEEKGNVEESKFWWVSKGNRYDTSMMLQDLYQSVKSLEDGQRVVTFDLSKYYKFYLFQDGKFLKDKNETSETFVFVNIKVNKSSNKFVSANQSMFGKFKGDSNWTLYNFEEADYWRSLNEYNFTIKDFTLSYENGGQYLRLQQHVIDFFSVFSNMKYIVNINLDNIYIGSYQIEVAGFCKKPFGSLPIDTVKLTTENERTIKVYDNYNFEVPSNLIVEVLNAE